MSKAKEGSRKPINNVRVSSKDISSVAKLKQKGYYVRFNEKGCIMVGKKKN